jgi:hypothetical protein
LLQTQQVQLYKGFFLVAHRANKVLPVLSPRSGVLRAQLPHLFKQDHAKEYKIWVHAVVATANQAWLHSKGFGDTSIDL